MVLVAGSGKISCQRSIGGTQIAVKIILYRPYSIHYSDVYLYKSIYITGSMTYRPLDIKRCTFYFTKWQIHPFISTGTGLSAQLGVAL